MVTGQTTGAAPYLPSSTPPQSSSPPKKSHGLG